MSESVNLSITPPEKSTVILFLQYSISLSILYVITWQLLQTIEGYFKLVTDPSR